MKPKLKRFQARLFCTVGLGIGWSFCLVPQCGTADSADILGAKTSEAIPWSRVGAKAGADYKGDGLAVIPTAGGARLSCVFQRLEGEATCEGLWLTSTVSNGVNDCFCVVAAEVGRQRNGLLSPTLSSREGEGEQVQVVAIAKKGTVAIDGQVARFTRPGLVEEYSVRLEGVRQDCVVLERPV